MEFRELAAVYESLGSKKKRLEIRAALAELLRRAPSKELPAILYLSQGQLRPEYEGIELGVADSLARRAIALATGASENEILQDQKRSGDLGTTVEERMRGLRRLEPTEPLTVEEVYRSFFEIARAQGEGSQEAKVRVLNGLLVRAGPLEAKYLIRFVLGQLRLGVREMTILDALAEAFGAGSKEARRRIEAAFNLTSDLGLVAEALAREGLGGLDSVRLEVGRPIRPMLAERSPSLADILERMGGKAALEMKYDGLRIQAHVLADRTVRLFSRRLESIGEQFPELVAALPEALTQVPSIVEGECVPVDPETDEIQPFQQVSRRRGRKYDLDAIVSEIPVSLFLFDVLLDGGAPLADLPFPERRERLVRLVKPSDRVRLADQRVVSTVEGAQEFFDAAVATGGEGIVAKSLAASSGYRAGGRGFLWIKYKREYTQALADSIDGVVVGAFHGRGRRAGRYGALLLAVYDPKTDRFESFCKVGSGFNDATLEEIPKRLREFEVETPPPSVDTGLKPDRWIRPAVVLEVRGAELTLSPIHRAALGRLRAGAGLALRFPRFTGRWREDKAATDATTTEELVRLYQTQVRRMAAEPAQP